MSGGFWVGRIARLLGGLLLIGVTAAHGAAQDVKPVAGARPRRIVRIAIAGLPQRQVLNYRDQLAPDGFKRLLQRGSWFANPRYGHGLTVAGAAHATLRTGA